MNAQQMEQRRRHVELACVLEATARKPGNVHPLREFSTLTYCDLLRSGIAIGPVLAAIRPKTFGQSVLDAIRATRSVTKTNANLGIVLLLAPLCCVEAGELRPDAVAAVIERLTVQDARLVYHAIREAKPGGLGEVEDQDVNADATVPLKQAMQLAADRDTIARQYSNGFQDVFEIGVPCLREAFTNGRGIEEAIVVCHLRWMAAFPDSLIVRKRGWEEAKQAARWANEILGDSANLLHSLSLRKFDAWLTAEGHGRNPGTSADLVAASVFCALQKYGLSDARFTS